MKPCTHLDQIRRVEPEAPVCRECEQQGSTWSDLAMCLTCGHVGCSDDSPQQHAKKHFETSGHPIAETIGTKEDMVWCYIDEMVVENV